MKEAVRNATERSAVLAGALLLCMLLAPGCTDDAPVQPSAPDRWVYYSMEIGGAPGLYRTSLVSGKTEQVSAERVVHISSVATNGVVLFEVADRVEGRYWGRCTTGSVIPVPFPVHSDATLEYAYAAAPHIALSGTGHRAAYPVYLRPVGSTDSTRWELRLAVFDCAAWQMATVDVNTFVLSLYAHWFVPPTNAFASGDYLCIDTEGRRAWMLASAVNMQMGSAVSLPTVLVEWSADSLRAVTDYARAPQLLGWLAAGDALCLSDSTGCSLLPLPNGPAGVPTTAVPRTPYQFPSNAREYVRFGAEAVEIMQLPEHMLILRVLRYADANAQFPKVTGAPADGRMLSIAPDGAWLVCALQETDGTGLYAVRRDGTDLRRLNGGRLLAPPVVSAELR
jgi:hypothetical protein